MLFKYIGDVYTDALLLKKLMNLYTGAWFHNN